MPTALALPDIVQGTDYSHTLRFWTTAAKTARLDLSGRTYAITTRHLTDSSTVPFSIDTTNLATGLIVLTLTDEQTTLLRVGSVEWALEETASSIVTSLFADRVSIRPLLP